MDEISNIIRELVGRIDNTIEGQFNPALTLTESCKTKWIRSGKIVTDESGESFLVDAVVPDESIQSTYIGTTIPAPVLEGTISLPAPFFISGTKLATNREWTIAGSNVTEKTPIIWLLETIQERRFGKGDSRSAEYELRIFFLDETNIKDFYTEDHRREVVLPMQKLVSEFISVIENDKSFKTLENYSMRTFSRFGVETSNGVFQNVLDANLSGVELILTLTKYKEKCKC